MLKSTIAAIGLGLLLSSSVNADQVETMARVGGAILGSASACGIEPSENHIRKITRKVLDTPNGAAERERAKELLQKYIVLSHISQSTSPTMTCAQVRQIVEGLSGTCNTWPSAVGNRFL